MKRISFYIRIYNIVLLYIMLSQQQSVAQTNQSSAWTGTGFAIGNGYIATNYHVAEDANSITVKVIKNDLNISYSADVIATDKVNDIAILKITDSHFKGFGVIPYAVSTRMADVGEDVFVLGYPLTQALGDEIKLTNGIISSRTGYLGDVSLYQMSAPVQPGNSGGPMFDNKGNVIGIIVAGIPGAENVGYAIKTSYLKNLIESAGLSIRLPSNNTLTNLSLVDKIKRIKSFVFYIECENHGTIESSISQKPATPPSSTGSTEGNQKNDGTNQTGGQDQIISDDYVDLGLPSGTLWKDKNEKGYYLYPDASSIYGERLPTKTQWEELKKYCTWSWVHIGYKITGPNGNYIFLHAAGYRGSGHVSGSGLYGGYWSSSFTNESNISCALHMEFRSDYVSISNDRDCNYEYSVRLVR